MPDVNIEKDDQATLEMLEMMGELSDDKDSGTDDSKTIDVDDLLDSLDDLTNTAEEEIAPSIQEPDTISDEVESKSETQDLDDSLDLEDIDALMSEIDNDIETSIEVTTPTEEEPSDDHLESKDIDDVMSNPVIENTVDENVPVAPEPAEPPIPENSEANIDMDDLNDMDADLSPNDIVENSTEALTDSGSLPESVKETKEMDIDLDDAIADEPSLTSEDTQAVETAQDLDQDAQNDAEETDAVELEQADIASEVIEDEAIATSPEEVTHNETTEIIDQTQQSVTNMEEAIQIDQDIQKIASQVRDTAQEAIQIAISTSEKAHQSTEQIQQAIEATFAASERAFEAAKNAGYSIESVKIETERSPTEISAQLREIEEKNKQLKGVNQNIQERIANLKA